MLELDLGSRHGQQRFLRHANAVTQAEIRRMSRLEPLSPEQAHDAIETVAQELRRLSAPPRRRRARSDGAR